MLPLLEHQTKAWLSARGLPVPKGVAVASPEQAGAVAQAMPGGCVVKALVPTGRRGKSGGIRIVADALAASRAAADIIGTTLADRTVTQVYVEERVEIVKEFYLSYSLLSDRFQILVSESGGVDIEQAFSTAPEKVVTDQIDPIAGLSSWSAIELWRQAGLRGPLLRELGSLTAKLFDAFRVADALTLELNPLAVDSEGRLSLVGAMMAVDEHSLFRHPEWTGRDSIDILLKSANEREQRVRAANVAIPGGEGQYMELAGDIGLLVGGGGAGLYIHDLIVGMGGQPANHCVTPPTSSNTLKLKEVLRAILDNPRLRGLLVGFNFAQMARADVRIEALAEVLRERAPRQSDLPIVVRLFGPGEDTARNIAAGFSNITYLPRGTSLLEACRVIVDRMRQAS